MPQRLLMTACDVAVLFAAAAFASGRAERAIRLLFVSSFVPMVAAFAGLAVARRDLVAFEVTVIMITWIVLIPASAPLGLVFRRDRTPMGLYVL